MNKLKIPKYIQQLDSISSQGLGKELSSAEKLKLEETIFPATDYSMEEYWKRDYKFEPVQQVKFQVNLAAKDDGVSFVTLFDDMGNKYFPTPDYTKIETEVEDFSVSSILKGPKPKYIPNIDVVKYASLKYQLQGIRIAPDIYILATSPYVSPINRFDRKYMATTSNRFAVVTLDQIVLTLDYYLTRQKALNIQEAERANKWEVERWQSNDEDYRKRILFQNGFYNTLPDKIKKTISQSKYETLSLAEREKIFIPIRITHQPRRVSRPNSTLYISYVRLYEDFIDISLRVNRKRSAHPDIVKYWKLYSELLKLKALDFKVFRQTNSEVRAKAKETSFGFSNTDQTLVQSLGILAKRQNGSQIVPDDVIQIERAFKAFESSVGSLQGLTQVTPLIVSHTGNTNVFASKAVGMWIPTYNAIAVSAKKGDEMFQSIMAHELAHYLDYKIGRRTGKYYITSSYETLPSKIAATFRANMNRGKPSEYYNSTIECFARAIEQYFSIETRGEGAINYLMSNYVLEREVPYVDCPYYAPLDAYKQIKPIIEQFFVEYDFKPNALDSVEVERVRVSEARARRIRIIALKVATIT